MGRNPGRNNSENNSGQQGEQKGKTKDDGRGTGLDRKLGRIREGEGQNQVRASVGDGDANYAASQTQENALGEELANQGRSGGPECSADGGLGAAGGSAGEEKVGNVGTGNEQDERGNSSEQAEAVSGFLLQILDAAASRSEENVLLGNLFVISILCVRQLRGQPLTQGGGDLGLQAADGDSGLHPAKKIKPVAVRLLEDAGLSFQDGLVVERNPDGGRIGVDAVSEKSGRSDADQRDGVTLDEEGRSDQVAVGGMLGLPGSVTEDGDGSRARNIIGGREQASGVGADAEGREVIAGDVFGALRLCRGVADADAFGFLAGLEAGQLLELRGGVLDLAVKIVGEK